MCPDMISLQPVCSGLIGQTIFGVFTAPLSVSSLVTLHSEMDSENFPQTGAYLSNL